jgi:hypothetical protein
LANDGRKEPFKKHHEIATIMIKFCIKNYVLLFILISCSSLYAQSDIEQIIMNRNASNKAIKALDFNLSNTFLTDDTLLTTGSGTLLVGKEALITYINSNVANTMYFVRTPNEINVNTSRGLAWESGNWKGYNLNETDKVVVHGKYSAMWTKTSGKWLIKSQLFVTLE